MLAGGVSVNDLAENPLYFNLALQQHTETSTSRGVDHREAADAATNGCEKVDYIVVTWSESSIDGQNIISDLTNP